MIPYNRRLIEPAKELRTHPTRAEKCLWQRLQLKHIDYKFYRQKPLGNYIVDFFCPKARLIVEIDGGNHFTAVGKENDRFRDEYMKSVELKVLRFSNSNVINDTDKVVESIRKILLHHPFKKGDKLATKGLRPSVKKASSSFVKGGAEADLKKK